MKLSIELIKSHFNVLEKDIVYYPTSKLTEVRLTENIELLFGDNGVSLNVVDLENPKLSSIPIATMEYDYPSEQSSISVILKAKQMITEHLLSLSKLMIEQNNFPG